ncbi:MAG: hypothetical protein Q7R82_00325 [Candidatus Daviesbacteria bacterium]|nr:hypothetical protein [Candidatus Daviesbacteria bacterium]
MSESIESEPGFTPEQPTEIKPDFEPDVPAFLRRKQIIALHVFRQRMESPGERGGTYSPYDINSRPIELNDMKPPARDRALDASEIKCLTGHNNTPALARDPDLSTLGINLVDRDYERRLVVKGK